MKKIKKVAVGIGGATLGKSLCLFFITLMVYTMRDRKRSKTISVILRNHQYVDGNAHREIINGEANVQYQSSICKRKQSESHFYECLNESTLQYHISETDYEALKKLAVSLSLDQSMYSVQEEESQMYYDHVGDAIEANSEPKYNDRKKLLNIFGLGAATVVNTIVYIIQNPKTK